MISQLAPMRPIGNLATDAQRDERSVSAADRAVRSLERMARRNGGAARAKASAGGNGYDAVKSTRMRRKIRLRTGVAASPDSHQAERTSLQILELLRHHDRNSSLLSGLLDRAAENIIGSRYTIKPTAENDSLARTVQDYITEQMKKQNTSADRLHSFADNMGLTLRAIWNDGDILHTKRPDGSILTFESDQVITPKDKKTAKSGVTRGVKKGPLGEHLGYYVAQRPKVNDRGYSITANPVSPINPPTEFVKASNTIFPAYRKRFNQTRGMSFLAAVLSIFDRTDAWIDNESLAAEIVSMPAIKITDKNRDEFGDAAVKLTSDETKEAVNAAIDTWEDFRAGSLINFAGTGLDFEAFVADRPNANFDKFLTAACRLIGVAVGYPLELTMLDYSKSTFTSSQMGWDQTRRSFERWQMWLGEALVEPWYAWQIARGIAAGDIAPEADAFMPYIVLGDGRTFYHHALPHIQKALAGGQMPSSLRQLEALPTKEPT